MTPDKRKPGEPERHEARRRGRVFLRGGAWWCDFGHRGRRIRRPLEQANTERQAWDALELLRTEARQGRPLDVERGRWPNLAQRFLAHHEAKGTRPRTLARWTQLLAHLEPYFGEDRVGEIGDGVNGYVALRRKQGAAPASIRMELRLLVQMFRIARLPRPEVPTIAVSNIRRGFLTLDEVQRVIEHLPPPLRAPVRFAFYTCWRKSEVLGLEWRNVDLAAGVVRLDPGTTKSGAGRALPFAALPPLADLLREQREVTTRLERERRCVVSRVFHREGEPIRDMDDAWKAASRDAGLPGRVFHDLRRSGALFLRRLGMSESDIMQMAGWQTRSMFQRYCIEDESGLADRLLRAWNGTKTAQTLIRERVGGVE